MPIEITPVAGRRDLVEFVRLPRLLYAGLPGFVPPLDVERLELLDPKRAAFFGHGRAAYWIARRDGRAVGRIAAQIDDPAREAWGERMGCFGALDAADDREAVALLLATAARWLAAAGMTLMRGPLTLSINGEVGAQIEGQSRGSLILMPWHPPYLAAHVEAAGFAKAKDVVSYTLDMDEDFGRRFAVDIAAEPPPRPGFRSRHLDMKNLARDAEIIRVVYNDAWRGNWGHVPLSEGEAAEFARSLRHLIKPEYGVIVDFEDTPVGVGVLVPNIFEVVGDLGGRLLPFNWSRLVWRMFTHRWVHGRVIIFGVRRNTRDGRYRAADSVVAMRLIMRSLLHGAWGNGFRLIDMGWILEDNRVRKIPEQYGASVTTRYRVYERACAPV